VVEKLLNNVYELFFNIFSPKIYNKQSKNLPKKKKNPKITQEIKIQLNHKIKRELDLIFHVC
jgi:hypothetical protein